MALPLILIVDDNPESLTVLGGLLRPRPAVRVANSVLRALRLAPSNRLPTGLAGDAIPLAARPWAVADACDRLASAGLDQAAQPPGRWVQSVVAEGGRRFDPAVVDARIDSLAELTAPAGPGPARAAHLG